MTMVRMHPFCSLISLQLGTKLVAILDMAMGIIKLTWFIYMLKCYGLVSFQMIDEGEDAEQIMETKKRLDHLDLMPVFNATSNEVLSSHKAISLLTLAAYNIEGTIINLIIFVVLFVGASGKSITKCLIWFYIRATVLVFKFAIVVICLIAGRSILSQLPFIAVMLVHIYGLWIVNEFVEELKREKVGETDQNKMAEDCQSGDVKV